MPNMSIHERKESRYPRAINEVLNDPRKFAVPFSRLVLGLASFAGLVFWLLYDLSFLMFLVMARRLPNSPFEFYVLGFPLVYFMGSLISSLGGFRLRTLFIVGFFLNLSLLLPVVYWFSNGYGLAPLNLVCLFFILSWSGLLLARLKNGSYGSRSLIKWPHFG
jgi:hypothetical protein